MKRYYQKDNVTLYLGDCRDILPMLDTRAVIMTSPPWYERPDVAHQVVSSFRPFPEVLCQWNEVERPPLRLPLVALYAWNHTNGDGKRFQTFYHFAADGIRRRCEVFRHPAIYEGSEEYLGHPHQYSLALIRELLMKVQALPVIDPFCGSGTSLIAARELGRPAIGIEFSEAYAEIAARRLG